MRLKNLAEISPYFETENGILYCGDSLEIMPKLPGGIVDLILTDPPYNVSKEGVSIKRNGGKLGVAKDISLDFGDWDRGKVLWQDYIDKFVPLLTDVGVIAAFNDKLELGCIGKYLQDVHHFQVRHIGSWIKTNPVRQVRKVKWQNGSEMFLIATKNKGSGHHFNYKLGQSPDYFMHSVSYRHYHPTQKPLKVIEWIMNYWSFEGDLVLDPFMGSGTTAIACEELHRHWIGIELNPEYCEMAKQRILAATQQRQLF